MPPATRHLLCVNVVVWLISSVLYHFQGFNVADYLGLHYFEASRFNPVQLVTSMFLHDNHSIWHIFFNMFSLYMFGRILEQIMGSKRYLIYYMVCGIGAGLVQEAVWAFDLHPIVENYTGVEIGKGIVITTKEFLNMNVVVGASGAVFGLLLAFGMLLPNAVISLYFIIPMKAKYFVILFGLLELWFGVSGAVSGVAHFAHLGGLLFGLLLILYWRKKGIINRGGYY